MRGRKGVRGKGEMFFFSTIAPGGEGGGGKGEEGKERGEGEERG